MSRAIFKKIRFFEKSNGKCAVNRLFFEEFLKYQNSTEIEEPPDA